MVPDRIDKATGEHWTATADDVAYFTAEMANGAVAQVFMSGVAAHNMNNVVGSSKFSEEKLTRIYNFDVPV